MLIYKAFLSSFNNCPPVGYMLRERCGDHWLRIHSLPNSKRYPDNQEEIDELLRRNLELAQFVLEDVGNHVFIGIYGDDRDASIDFKWSKNLAFEKVNRIDISEEDDDPYFLNIYVSSIARDALLLSQIILDVAGENIGPVVFFSKSRSSVYAPYDGGADLFFKDKSKLARAKLAFREWTSKRTDGL